MNQNEFQVEQTTVMTQQKRKQYWILVVVWVAVNIQFWVYWLTNPSHIGNHILFILLSITFFYETTFLPSFYTFFLGWMRKPKLIDPQEAVHAGVVKKVAMITLTVPGSESLEIVKRQLVAMTKIKYPHDSWILVDKCHSPEIKSMAEELGVLYYCRHDISRWGQEKVSLWNQLVPPFKAKTKAGNVNSWIDAYGSDYSHFVQLDIDHLPVEDYLDKTLGFFLDRKVAWVQAPSVYGNLKCWTARGSAEQEFVLQGPLQMGFFGFCRTPFIIGSHCTYSMEAIKEIGGFQPTRAEDHLDTVFLASRGYQGVFLPETIAIGDGPESFETYIAQQFAWAFSMIQVLFKFTPKCISKYNPKQAIQFLFVQTWYTLWSLSMLILFMLPLVSLVFNIPIANVNFWEFFIRSLPVILTGTGIWMWSRIWHKPTGIGLSWRGIVLHIARWPIVFSALVQVILKVKKPYMITTKGINIGETRPFTLSLCMPYLVLLGMAILPCWAFIDLTGHSQVQGYLLYALQSAFLVWVVIATALVRDIYDMVQEGVSVVRSLILRLTPLILISALGGAVLLTGFLSVSRIAQALVGR